MYKKNEWLTFSEAINQTQSLSRNLLLGNGFSISCSKSFCYENLYEILDDDLKHYFNNSRNFEEVLGNLQYKANVYKQCIDESIGYYMYKDADSLARKLIECILNIHPRMSNFQNSQKYNTCLFLLQFHKIFTLNYDLLLYWIIIYYQMNKTNLNFKNICCNYLDDGFRSHNEFDCIWSNIYNSQNIFYLHGAVHLFTNEFGTYKIKRNRNETILSICKHLQENNIQPLTIVASNNEDKFYAIKSNEYLQYCYNQLYNIQGLLFIHGSSLACNDRHIFEAINNNKNITCIYISLHPDTENFNEKLQKAKDVFPNKSLYFYDANSTNIWKNKQI